MLGPTPSSTTSLPKAAAVDFSRESGEDVRSSNTDPSQAFLNTFDNSRPTSPAPPTTVAAPALHSSFCSPPRVLSPKITLDVCSQAESQVPPLLRTPPESPVKSNRRDSFNRQSVLLPPHQRELLTRTNGLAGLSSPPSSPTQSSAGATLPPKLSQSLAEHPLFRGCTPAGIHQLASRMHIRHYHPQDHIIRRSEQSSAMFYLLRGAVKVVSHDNEATYYEIKENNFFGDVGVLYRVPRSMDVLAKNRCTIAILSGDDLVKAMEQSPEMAKAIGYQTQERYQMYLKRRKSISARRTLDGGSGTPDECQDDSRSDSFAKSDVHSAIRKVPLFQSCSTEVIHLLSLKVEPRTYNLGESIIRRGEIGREMFFIASGVVEILSDDNLRVLARFHDGQFFGEIAVLLDVPRIANVKAVSQVEVFVLTKDNLEAVFEAVPGAAETITAEGHRLYQNWLIKNSQQKREQATDDDESLQGMEAELNYESLNVPRRLSVPILQSKEGNVAAVSAMQGTDQQGSPPRLSPKLSPMSIHPIEAGHPAAISVLPMAPMDEYLLGNRITASPPATTSPPTDLEGGPFNEHALAPAHAQESQPVSKESFFDQDMGTAPTLENQQEPPTSRNPTIRGLQQSNPKRRRASVAVWTQQDLLKLAESAEAKASISTTHAPATASAMATSLLPTAATDDTQKKDAAEKSAQAKRSSRIPFVNKSPIKKLTGPATFQDLDESIVIQILNGLPLNRLLRVRSVCKSWNKLILEHNSILRDVDLSKHKKIVTDTLLKELCDTILSRNPTRTTRISLRDCFLISDKGLAMLATHMPAVQDLDLHSCWNVTDAGFRLLGVHCSQLRSIDFSNCRKLGDETIFGLYPKEAMTVANVLPKEGLVDAVLGPQAVAHPELKDMVEQDPLSADTSMDEAQVQLKHRPSIETESAQETQTTMDIEPPNHTAELPSKQPATTASQAAAPGPKGCPLLARLNLSYCKNLTDRSFIHLSLYGSKQLEYLNLQRCTTITSEAFMSLDLESKGAVHEDIMTNGHGNDVEIPTHEGYNPLVEPCFPQLRELHLSDCTFLTDDAIIALAPNMPRIEVVSLSFCCALTDVAVEAMCGSCSFLKKLDLSFCGSAVSDASLYQLARFDALEPGRHSLRELEIRGCVRVTERGVREVLNGCANMTKLNISSCSGIGTGDLSAPVPEQTLVSGDQAGPGEDVSMSPALQSAPQAEAQEQSDTAENTNVIGGSTKSWESLPNPTQSGELARKMDALKKGKEWALAQQRPGLKIIV